MMAETCLLAESAICYPPLYDELRAIAARPTVTAETVAIAAVAAASEQNADAILVLSTSGNTARLISKYRPRVPIITGETIHMAVLVTRLSLVPQLHATNKRPDKFTCTAAVIHFGILSHAVSRNTSGRRT